MSEPPTQSKPNPSQELVWRLFYVFSCILILDQFAYLPDVESFGVMELIDLVVSALLFVALTGFVFYKPIGTVIFWRYFFYVALGEVTLVLVFFPLLNIPLYGIELTSDMWLLNLGYLGLNLWALNLYAFKYRFIWVADEKTE